jgi:GNAT superfamily N-acetyltransferase
MNRPADKPEASEAIAVSRAGSTDYGTVLDLVQRLLTELADDPAEFAGWDAASVATRLETIGDQFVAFLAWSATGQPVGVATLTEAFAAYAQGWYGIISELYVLPEYRSRKIGHHLLQAVKRHAKERAWKRVDVTAPPEPRWQRTVAFYEENGFVFTGPKMRFQLDAE